MDVFLFIAGIGLLIAATSITHCHEFMGDGHVVRQAEHPLLFWGAVAVLAAAGVAALAAGCGWRI